MTEREHCGEKCYLFFYIKKGGGASQVAQVAPSLSMQEPQETWVLSLGGEDSLEEEMATNSSILVWKIPWTEEPGGLQSMASQTVRQLSNCK